MDLHYGSGGEYLSDATFLERTALQQQQEEQDGQKQKLTTITTLSQCPQLPLPSNCLHITRTAKLPSIGSKMTSHIFIGPFQSTISEQFCKYHHMSI